MKRVLSLILCASFLICAAPAAFGGDDMGLAPDAAAPFTAEEGALSVPVGTTASEVRSCFHENRAVTVVSAADEELSLTDPVGSGAVVSRGADSVTVVVPGDVNGDSKINVRDVVAAMRSMLGASVVCESAADVDRDGTVNARDIRKLMRYLVGWDEELLPGESETALFEDASLTMYFDSMMHRIGRSDTTVYGDPSGVCRMAKNEIEDVQVVLCSTEQKSGLTIEVGALTSDGGATLDFELRFGYYYELTLFNKLRGGNWQDYNVDHYTDPYPMQNGQSFEVGENESKSFMIKIDAPADAEAGWYSAPVVVRDAAGREIKRSTVRVYVWDFALDEETACDTLFCTSSKDLFNNYANKGYDVSDWETVYAENWYGYLLKNRLNGYVLPYEITDDRADAYMDDPRVTAFVTAGGQYSFDWTSEEATSALRAKYDKLKTNEAWLDKAYVYTVDEPGTDVAPVKAQWENASALLSDVHFQTMIPGASAIEDMFDYCNAFAPCSDNFLRCPSNTEERHDEYNFPPYGRYNTSVFRKYGQFTERYDKLRQRGDNLWWYICVSPEYPYANLFNSYQGAWNRMVLWQQYMNGVDGLLYWNTIFWVTAEHGGKPITMTRTNRGGDGLLLYDGDWWGEGMVPVPSIRFEALRDGIEDFQYLKQLERLTGREESMTYVSRLTTGMLTFEEDYREMMKVRDELGFCLESLGN